MQKHRSSERPGSVLRPTVPPDIVGRTQRQRIIDALIESCAEKTYATTTITDIVARAHISRTTFYKHFDDKRSCFDASLDHCLSELQDIAAASHDSTDPPADAARKAAIAVLETLAARPGLAQLLTGDAIALQPRVFERYRRATVPALEALWQRDGGKPQAHTDPRLAFGQAQVLILNHIAAGKGDRLPELRGEIVYLTVSPYGGHEEALEQARTARETETGSSVER